MTRWLWLLAPVALGACASQSPLVPDALPESQARLELEAVPFHPQTAFHCGPASLATVLGASGVAVAPDALAERVYLPGRRGSLQAEMVAASRGHGRIAYRLAPEPDAVFAELAEGRPVLVLMNLGLGFWPVWHYAVVIGFDAERDHILLRSGEERRKKSPGPRWLRQWDRAGRWAVVLLAPGELPARPERRQLLQAVADFEAQAGLEERKRAWRAVLEWSPEEPVGWLGLANALLEGGDVASAEDALRRVLELEPGHPAARYNLAVLHERRGAPCRALEMLGELAGEPPPPVILERVEARIEALEPQCRP